MRKGHIITTIIVTMAMALAAGCTAATPDITAETTYAAETEGTVESTEDIETKAIIKESNHAVRETTATETIAETTAVATKETTAAETTEADDETQAAKTEKPAKTESTKPAETKREASPMTDGTPAEETKPEEPAKAPAEQPEEKHEAPAEQPAPAPAPTEAPKPAETEAPKPAETEAPKHEHSWKEHYATRQVLVREAWTEEEYVGDETRDIIEEHTFCNGCGADVTGIGMGAHADASEGGTDAHGGWSTRSVVVGQETVPVYIPVFHDAEYTTEQYVDYYYCDCGARK